ncbi:ribosome biogenesis protein WDR12 homolog [Babylonia areolata]|uniref:ribosome biogenesis protein WDR12 homolog n=1 Tax=Babylonia areolata TaxID=304850 RepID=UPI003FD67439
MAEDREVHVQVKFFTKQKQYAIPDTPLTVPVDVGRGQLSNLINTILAESREESSAGGVQFDFLLDGDFILTSLSEHLQNKIISAETVFDIEYVEKQAAPRPEQSLEHDDWVCAIQGTKDYILSGCYDATARLWSQKGDLLVTIPGHSAPLKCVGWIRHDESEPVSSFVTGSHDQTALVWHWRRDTNDVDCLLSCRGHAASVDCVSVSPSGEQMCTGSWDKMLKLWSTDCTLVEESKDTERPSKKQKSASTIQTRVPVLTLSGHTEAISAVQWLDKQKVVTSSWDHSLRLWDMQAAQQTTLLPGTKAFLDVSYSQLSHMLVAASADRHVRLFDPRSSEGVVVKCAFTSHTGWVSGVDWSPTREHLFMSGSYDGISKLWDTRSPKAPLFDMKLHEDKILAVDWSVPDLMLSGGADNQLHIFSYSAANLATCD